MIKTKRFAIVLAMLLGLGCATPAKQTDALLLDTRGYPEFVRIQGILLQAQSGNYCGPSTLAMALNWALKPGVPITVEEMVDLVYTPGKEGTYQNDLVSASRRKGALAIPIYGLPALLHEVAGGHPVIILENLGFSWYAKWHYALVVGFDLKEKELILHSGNQAYQTVSMRSFERAWMLGDYWGLVVLPPSLLSTTADELAHVEAASVLEEMGNLEAANQIYLNVLRRWPNSFSALIGLGNIAYAKKDFSGAVRILKQATEEYPNLAEGWHNLAAAQGSNKKMKDAHRSALRALDVADPDQIPVLRESLKDYVSK